MWLQEFFRLFPEATERYTGRRQDLAALEREFDQVRSSMRVGPAELQVIEESPGWTYQKWWPRLSVNLAKSIQLPEDIETDTSQRKAIETLFEALRHIEVVSAVLRFLRPDHFGIISPPVVSLLVLTPSDNHADDYMDYLKVLDDLRKYGRLERVADVDMALWSAAHLAWDYPALSEEMSNDEYFEEIRFENLLRSFKRERSTTGRQCLLYARAILKYDHLAAAAIAAYAYEKLVKELARKSSIHPNPKLRQTDASSIVDKLERQPELLHKLDRKPGDLRQLWKWRNQALHEEPTPITRRDAEKLVREVGTLWSAFASWL
jgi:hypothetical protein